MPILTDRNNDTIRTVKNLGWLLRHAQYVTRFEVSATIPGESDHSEYAACLSAYLRSYAVRSPAAFHAKFSDSSVLWDWIQRSAFIGVMVNWGTAEPFKIAKPRKPFPGYESLAPVPSPAVDVLAPMRDRLIGQEYRPISNQELAESIARTIPGDTV